MPGLHTWRKERSVWMRSKEHWDARPSSHGHVVEREECVGVAKEAGKAMHMHLDLTHPPTHTYTRCLPPTHTRWSAPPHT